MSIINTITRMEGETNRINFERGQRNMGSDRLDKQAFMQLLMAKLKLQDPLNPEKDADFMAQQAQLAQVEKMDDLVKVMQGNSLLSQAGTLVGKQVDVTEENGTVRTGVIDSISISNGTAAASINGKNYSLNQIAKIYSGNS